MTTFTSTTDTSNNKNIFYTLISLTPPWIRKYFSFLLIFILSFILLRLIFLLYFFKDIPEDVKTYISKAFYIGTKFDIRLATILCLPIPFITIFMKNTYKKFNIFLSLIYSILFTFILTINISDIFHYVYLAKRINADVFDLLEDLTISMSMVWETYPVIKLSLLLIFTLTVTFYIFYKLLSISDSFPYTQPSLKYRKTKKTLRTTLVFLFSALLIYGQLSAYPLRWSNAYFCTDNFITNFALNPTLNLYETYKFSLSHPYSIDNVKKYYPIMKKYLSLEDKKDIDIDTITTDSSTLASLFERKIPSNPKSPAKGYNVILIIAESLSWNKLSWTNPQLDATPFLNKIMKDSIVFSNFYSPALGTARGVFATMTSIPDVTTLKSSSRNPSIINQNIIIDQLSNYDKYYFLGGSANWGNIRGLLQNNIKDLIVYEEGSYSDSSKVIDVWGISDLSLFKEASSVFYKRKDSQLTKDKPFFAVIQSSGFHRPYTIPDEKDDFKILTDIDPTLLSDGSFISLDEYNSLRFFDYSTEVFFNKLKEYHLLDNTIVAIIGDHGLTAPKSTNMPEGYTVYNLINHQTPFIIYAPKILVPKVIDFTGSQIDTLPTLVGLLGEGYTTSSLGRDLLNPIYNSNNEQEGVLIYGSSSHPQTVSFINSDLLMYDNKVDTKGLFRYKDKECKKDLKDSLTKEFEDMATHADALYENAKYLLYHNNRKY